MDNFIAELVSKTPFLGHDGFKIDCVLEVDFIAPTLNELWSTNIHWSRRAKIKKAGVLSVLVEINDNDPAKRRQSVTSHDLALLEFIPIIYAGRSYDSINYATTAKVIEDALVHFGVLVDDSPKYVAGSFLRAPVRAELNPKTRPHGDRGTMIVIIHTKPR